MQELIKIHENKEGTKLVSARDLHAFLESKQDFSNWMNGRIKKYGFVENQDFSSFNKIIEREKGASVRIEYALTLDTAKELAMVEGNEKGKQARQYFIACEKRLREVATPQLPNAKQLAQMVIDAENEKEKVQLLLNDANKTIEANKPKIVFADSVSVSDDAILIGELAKILKQNEVEMGQNRLFKWMRENGYLIRRNGTDYNMPTQYAMEKRLFKIKETSIAHSDGRVTISKTAKVTGEGQVHFINKFLTARP